MILLCFTSVMWAYLQGMPLDRMQRRGMPGRKAMYGWAAQDEEADKCAETDDYYVGISEAFDRPLGSRDLDYGPFYPERLFAFATDSHDAPLPRENLRELLAQLKLRDKWEPCRVWRGYRSGEPVFFHALRAHADWGCTWRDVQPYALREKELPAAWYSGTQHGRYWSAHIDD
jgi:hypothetical protein